ncbi:MAG TPA: hypothetical protein VH934_18685 [Xanthobacteraceae bacterium]|jgi:hypothetical protein
MKRSTLAITALVMLLLLSNAFWLYRIVDERIGAGLEAARQREALRQVFALIPVLAQKADRARIVAAASDATSPPNKQALQADGYVWVGSLGLRFDGAGELVEVVTKFPKHSTGIIPAPGARPLVTRQGSRPGD